jgi:hypothetical protein
MLYVLTHDRQTEGVDFANAQEVLSPPAAPDARLAERIAWADLDTYDWEQSDDWCVDFFDDDGVWLAAFELRSEVRREIDAFSISPPPSILNRDEGPEPDRLTLPLFGDEAQ